MRFLCFMLVLASVVAGCGRDPAQQPLSFRTGRIRTLSANAPPTPPLALEIRTVSSLSKAKVGEPIDCVVCVAVPDGAVLPTWLNAQLWARRHGRPILADQARAEPKERDLDGAYIFTARLLDDQTVGPGRYDLIAEAIVVESRVTDAGPEHANAVTRRYQSETVPIEVQR